MSVTSEVGTDAELPGIELPDVEVLKRSRSLKWSSYPGKLAMWVAEMDYGIAPAIREALQLALDEGLTGYTPPSISEEVLEAMRDFQLDSFGYSYSSQDTGLSLDVLSVLRAILSALPQGSPVVVPTPAYMPFLSIPKAQGHPVIEVASVVDENASFSLDYEGIRQGFLAGAKLLVLCNPWNPVGKALSLFEMQVLDSVLAEFPDVLVFNDEIHSPLMIEGVFHSYLEVSAAARSRTVTATAASKGWNIPGLHCAQWICTDEVLRRRLRTVLKPLSGGAASWGMLASTAAYRDSRDWLEGVKIQLRNNVESVKEWMLSENISDSVLRVHLPQATYLSWWETDGKCLGQNPAETLLDAGLVVNDGATLGEGYEHCFRLNLATTAEVLAESLKLISVTLK